MSEPRHYDASRTGGSSEQDSYEGPYAGSYGVDDYRPPLPYTQSELDLEDHPATRTPDYYSPASLPSEEAPAFHASRSASSNQPGPRHGRGSGRGSARSGPSSGDDRGRTWEERRARGRERQAQGRARAAAAAAAAAAGDEDSDRDLCCAIVGPWRPFWGRQSLADVATSHALPPRAFLIWRLVLFASAAAALTLTAVRDTFSLRGTQLIALLFAVYIPLRLAYVTYRYMGIKGDGDEATLHTRSSALAHIVLLYQGNLVLQVFSPIGLWLTLRSEMDRPDVNGLVYSGRADIFIPVASLLILSVIDMFFSALSFRLTYVIPTVIYGTLFMALTLYRYGAFRRGVYLGMSTGALLAIALLCLLLGRGLNMLVRRRSAMTRRNSDIHAFESSPSTEGVEADEEPSSASYDLEGGQRANAF